ncbi:UDP-glucose 4-epimerase GalE [Vreelandella zhanjiangensis]|uniref:UDP-glucose 4-epimerase GalE n=1 Tax=Vreelandella zhanjiangensis TaxID=1121960 RepID=UPI00402AF100
MSKLLVVGGCGYIGSHTVKHLLYKGHDVVVLDNLSTGFKESLLGGALIIGNCGNRKHLDRLLATHSFDGVLHFASLIQVGEPVVNPGKYYLNNVVNTLTLLQALKDHQVGPLVFSSTAAVYGEPQTPLLSEDHTQKPLNPYGMSKLMVEHMLKDFSHAYGLRSVALRYFNASGADPLTRIGERHAPETHLIPLALQAALGLRGPLSVYGRDYATPDGTCIRDYIHVDDLAEAHLLALEYLWQGGETAAFNLGNGDGFSVQQVLDTIEGVTGYAVPFENAPRRSGDPARLVADAQLAKQTLGWAPRYATLPTIIKHAWQWEAKRPSVLSRPTKLSQPTKHYAA